MGRPSVATAKSIPMPDWAWDKLNSIHKEGKPSLAEVLTSDGDLHEREDVVFVLGVYKPFIEIIDEAVSMFDKKRVTPEIFGTVLMGVILSYIMGSYKWEKSPNGMPMVRPFMNEKLNTADKVKLRNGSVMDTKDFLGHVIHHTSEEEVKPLFNRLYKTGPLGSFKEPTMQETVALLRTIVRLCNTHLSEAPETE